MKLIPTINMLDHNLRHPTYDLFSTTGPLENIWANVAEEGRVRLSILQLSLYRLERP